MSTTVSSQLGGIIASLAIKAPVHAVATSNITLSGLQTVGGVVLDGSTLYRVLCTAQTNPIDNGIWDVSSGTWARSKDFDGTRDVVKGTLVTIATSTNILYRVTTSNPITPGATPIAFEIVSVNLTQADITAIGMLSTGLKYDRTPAEIATSVVPIDYSKIPNISPRHGMLFDNSTDDRAALVRLLSAGQGGATKNGPRKVRLTTDYIAAPVAAAVSDGVSFDPAKLILDGESNTLDFSTKTSGAISCIKMLGIYDASGSRQALQNGTRGIRDLFIVAPSAAVNTNVDNVGLEILDGTGSAGSYRAPAYPIENVSIIGGKTAVRLGNGAWGISFHRLNVGHDAANTGGIGIETLAPYTDGGEPSTFDNCLITNRTYAFKYALGGALIQKGRIDGCPTISQLDGVGTHQFVGGYSEFTDGDNTQYKFSCTDAQAKISITAWEFTVRPDILAARTYPLINCSAGEIIINSAVFYGNNTAWYTANGGFLVTGSGTVFASNIRYKNFTWCPLVHKTLQWITYPDINNANWAADMVLANTGAGDDPVRVAGVADGAAESHDVIRFKINNAGVNNDDSYLTFTKTGLIPGRRVSVVGRYFTTGFTGSAIVFEIASATFKDSDGNTLSTSNGIINTTTQIANYTTFGFDVAYVPAGAASLDVILRLRATAAVTADKIVNVTGLGIGYAEGS